jgi:outer membrane protein assembly factor BamA
MLPLGRGAKQTPISDRFFLGGSNSLRGFHANSAGPHSERRGAPSQVLHTHLSLQGWLFG